MLRFRLDKERVHIGRDRGNDIWLEHPNVPPHALVIYQRDGRDNLKVYDGAKVLLNGVAVTGMHRLYSGDRVGVVDREFLYAEDSTPPDVAIGLSVLGGEEVERAVVMRRTRLLVGRRDCDIDLHDPSVGERHLVLECYSAEAIFAVDLGASGGTVVDGEVVQRRRRLSDGALLRLGRVLVRLHVLPVDAHGLLLKGAAMARPADEGRPRALRSGLDPRPITGQRSRSRRGAELDVGETGEGRPIGGAPPGLPPAPTVIGSLADLGAEPAGGPPPRLEPRGRVEAGGEGPAPQQAGEPRARSPGAERSGSRRSSDGARPRGQPRGQGGADHRPDGGHRPAPADTWRRAPPAGPDRRPSPQKKRRGPPEGPSVRVRPDLIERGGGAADEPPSAAPPRPEAGSRPRAGARRDDSPRRYASGRSEWARGQPLPGRAPGKRGGFHDQLTDVLGTDNVKAQVRDHFRRTGDHAPAWMELEEERYRPSKEAAARSRGPGRGAEPPTLRRRGGEQDAPMGRRSGRRGAPREFRQVDQVHLTNVLDVVPDRVRLDHGRHPIEADSHAQPRGRRGGVERSPGDVAPPHLRPSGPVDDARRRHRRRAVDDSPRYYDDED